MDQREMGPVKTIEVVAVDLAVACETFCDACGQLRLWGNPERPTACGHCGSESIETGPVGGERLPELRAAWRSKRAGLECTRKPGRACQADYGEPARCEWCDRLMP